MHHVLEEDEVAFLQSALKTVDANLIPCQATLTSQSVTMREPTHGRFILETALEQGIDLPYACTMGVCGMCRAKKISGDMHLGDQEALSTSEIASGACLTCVGKPLSKRLVIDYDVPN